MEVGVGTRIGGPKLGALPIIERRRTLDRGVRSFDKSLGLGVEVSTFTFLRCNGVLVAVAADGLIDCWRLETEAEGGVGDMVDRIVRRKLDMVEVAFSLSWDVMVVVVEVSLFFEDGVCCLEILWLEDLDRCCLLYGVKGAEVV
jgi:hypothetical protein